LTADFPTINLATLTIAIAVAIAVPMGCSGAIGASPVSAVGLRGA